mmetsp:Transcript_8963/g.14561  ORF Transcript_8963/g.14561 Transcript_8963/m.14561 type:complete len:107 (+) Transcript_8963:181-501(+)
MYQVNGKYSNSQTPTCPSRSATLNLILCSSRLKLLSDQAVESLGLCVNKFPDSGFLALSDPFNEFSEGDVVATFLQEVFHPRILVHHCDYVCCRICTSHQMKRKAS